VTPEDDQNPAAWITIDQDDNIAIETNLEPDTLARLLELALHIITEHDGDMTIIDTNHTDTEFDARLN